MDEEINGIKCLGVAELKTWSNGRTENLYWFECPLCGKHFKARKYHILYGNTKSCGCMYKCKYGTKHPLYSIWHGMLARCGYHKGAWGSTLQHYADRGVTVYEPWVKSSDAFIEWCLDNGWHEGLEIDRKDNNGGYYPENCRFVTRRENVNNRRNTARLPDGMPLSEYVESLGLPAHVTDSNGKTHPSKEYYRLYNKLIRK